MFVRFNPIINNRLQEKKKTEEKQTIRNPAARTDMFNFAMGQRQYAFTCMALLPNFTTSNSIMFSMPFSWWWPFIRPAPFTPLPFSPAPFFPFFPPWNRNTYAVTLPAEHTKYTYNWRFKEIQTLLKKRQVSFTFPFAVFVVLPSGSSEKSVSDENRVSVSLLSTKNNNLEKTLINPCFNFKSEPITYWGKGNSDGISGAAIIFVTSSGKLQLKTGF